jgi:2-polyprenyl-6-methoxyphenol hydroxylase-like FAD-dependent oxidoreductase
MTQNVLIIGAGPVGLTLAIELARYAVPVRIVEKAAHRTDKSKALVLWSRTLELLDHQPGGSEPFREVGIKADAVNFFAGEKRIGRVSMDAVETPYPYALMIPQSETERAGRQGGTQVEAVSVSLRSDGADVVLHHLDGREESASAHPLTGRELRELRRHQRDSGQVALRIRVGARRAALGAWLLSHDRAGSHRGGSRHQSARPYAAPRLRLQACE